MNTHDIDIELPPEFRSGNSVPVERATIKRERMEEILRYAIESDRKRRSEPVAYLDLGVGGYMDVGTALTDEQLAALPKGRHMLGIIGTYGVDGYREAAPQPAEPDVLPGEAILGFSAWLTSLKTPVTFSECHGAAIGADLAAAYNTSQGFIQVREDFHKRLKPYPKYEPSQPVEPVKVPSDQDIEMLAVGFAVAHRNGLLKFARALLARYRNSDIGQPAQPRSTE